MSILRWLAFAGAGYGLYKLGSSQPGAGEQGPRIAGQSASQAAGGLSAIFATREHVELAVEHLVQEHQVERGFIYIEPLTGENTAGMEIGGADHASGDPGSSERRDAPLNGAIKLTVSATRANAALLRHALEEAGAERVTEI